MNSRQIITDPDRGLLPFLDATLQENIGGSLIRGWSYQGVDPVPNAKTGWKPYLDKSMGEHGIVDTSFSLSVGHILEAGNISDAKLDLLDFRNLLQPLIREWSECQGAVHPVNELQSAYDIIQDKRVPSNKLGAWKGVLETFFKLEYQEYYIET